MLHFSGSLNLFCCGGTKLQRQLKLIVALCSFIPGTGLAVELPAKVNAHFIELGRATVEIANLKFYSLA